MNQGPFKYYVIKIWALLDHTYPLCNKTLSIKQTNLKLLFHHLAGPLDYVIFE